MSRADAPKADRPRQVSYEVVRAVSDRGSYANLLLPKSLNKAGLSGRDAAFATELTYGALRRMGTYDAIIGVETSRILVTLATGIPEERCRRVDLGYIDYRTIDPQEWAGREAESVLLVPHASEMLYRGELLFHVEEQ